jgi:acyl-CoA synthetase (AMP-forming)/AMP-acid ligase II/thioesterase domain-containing protein
MTITESVRAQALRRPDAVFLSTPESEKLTFSDLEAQLDRYAGLLALHEARLETRIGIVLTQPLQLAAALLSVAAGATAVPLYTHLPRAEYLRSFKAAEVQLLLSDHEPAISAAGELGISVVHPSANWISGHATPAPPHAGFLIGSSGSTGVAKFIPRLETSFVLSNQETAQAWGVGSDDLFLNPLPLCHSFGMALLGMGLVSGCEVVLCAPFAAGPFAALVRERRPTLLPLPPTMLAATLEVLRDRPLEQSRLRYIGSGASHLSTTLLDELEAYFGVPLIEGYGSTEVSAIAINPIPPGKPKRGSVGVPRVPIRFGEDGEIIVQAKYPTTLLQPGEWWHTGDLGYLDEEGYLFLTGRSREMINRGAQCIAPREIEEVLSKHPGVEAVACYSVPHADLGEEVGATVVLRDPTLSKEALMSFAAQHLSFAKVPKQLVFRNQLDLGPTGKPLRVNVVPPSLLELWSELFGRSVGPDDNFFDLGGTSLKGAELLNGMEELFEIRAPLDSLFSAPTPRSQAEMLRKGEFHRLVPLREVGSRTPIFFVNTHSGSSHYLRPLVAHLPEDQPCYGVFPDWHQPGDLAQFLQHYVSQIRSRQPQGPYRLAGYSLGGQFAYEVAQRLLAEGEEVEALILFDTPAELRERASDEERVATTVVDLLKVCWRIAYRVPYYTLDLWNSSWTARRIQVGRYLGEFMLQLPVLHRFVRKQAEIPKNEHDLQLERAAQKILTRASVRPYPGRLLLVRARYQERRDMDWDRSLGWASLAPRLKAITLTCTHYTILHEPCVKAVARAVTAFLNSP